MKTDAGQEARIDVAIVGAGPAGLMTANLLGGYGVTVRVFESGAELIDYPRGVGMDDETLRTFQAAGLVQEVLPHTIPHQILAFVDRRWRDLARLHPSTGEFGWPRRNGFVQPLADQVLLRGLGRFGHVDVQWSSRVEDIEQDADGVTLRVSTPEGERSVRATYVVGADGGRSSVRKALGLAFEGRTAPENWIVVDLRNDPLGRPGAYVCADPARPFVCLSIPHGIRRFEFMMLPGETEEQAMGEGFVEGLMRPFVGADTPIEIIRRRVYAHNSRLAAHFRKGRVFLIGDAAHIMPVWQGQGYNSGIRDALNLAWKLALAVRGNAAPALLGSYETERRAHVKAMVDLSRKVGTVVSIRNPFLAGVRDVFFRSISVIPRVKSYIVQMRFKPMPTMDSGALTHIGAQSKPTPVGRIFPQPTVATREDAGIKLDDAVGSWFTLIAWNNDPRAILDQDAQDILEGLGARLATARPAVQLNWDDGAPTDGVVVIGDVDGSVKGWFDAHLESVLLIRPDRIVAGAAPAFSASDMVRDFARTIGIDGMSAARPPSAAPRRSDDDESLKEAS
ncbi:bifunctional 3-(3-hydroxy-phenyl)propionate/3-hydroxycinnamic acid hydroxylase [Microbacterium lushaniae]|nr:bifunctional 3-(3-hydroxy-phenyl)propionate/3-hydroxycinnamic acid hydroxylase [Microbacterium lushaniae]KAA9151582.1 bifunctional 3-(3-hydroxy-phenyl)propionate/3-hydroxycinnamic acid hydroxylase [Microbacterium lushaniae]